MNQFWMSLLLVGVVAELENIEETGEECRCDRGYPGSCGCGKSMSDYIDNLLDYLGRGWKFYEGRGERIKRLE